MELEEEIRDYPPKTRRRIKNALLSDSPSPRADELLAQNTKAEAEYERTVSRRNLLERWWELESWWFQSGPNSDEPFRLKRGGDGWNDNSLLCALLEAGRARGLEIELTVLSQRVRADIKIPTPRPLRCYTQTGDQPGEALLFSYVCAVESLAGIG